MRDTNTRLSFLAGKQNVLTSRLLVNSFNEKNKSDAGVNKIQEVYSRICLT